MLTTRRYIHACIFCRSMNTLIVKRQVVVKDLASESYWNKNKFALSRNREGFQFGRTVTWPRSTAFNLVKFVAQCAGLGSDIKCPKSWSRNWQGHYYPRRVGCIQICGNHIIQLSYDSSFASASIKKSCSPERNGFCADQLIDFIYHSFTHGREGNHR